MGIISGDLDIPSFTVEEFPTGRDTTMQGGIVQKALLNTGGNSSSLALDGTGNQGWISIIHINCCLAGICDDFVRGIETRSWNF